MAASLAFEFAARGQTNTIIIPKEVENRFGNLWESAFAVGRDYMEQIYAASEFNEIAAVPILIIELAFRVDNLQTEKVVTWPSIKLDMDVFPGSMAEIVDRKSGVEDYPNSTTTVFEQSNFSFAAKAGDGSSFELRFPLQTPFLYDPRLGQLVLSIHAIDASLGLDAALIYKTPDDPNSGSTFDRGAYIYWELFGPRQVNPLIAATRITFTSTFLIVNSIRSFGEDFQIYFTPYPSSSKVQIEAATIVTGPYNVENTAEVSSIGNGEMRAVLPITDSRRFFRVRLDPTQSQ
jgi:hypothetical protein